MSRMRVAVVGGGVSGLAAAYILAKDGAEVVVYEKEDTLGGQAKTVIVDGTPLDLGFMVFSRVIYLDMMELFENLGVDRELSDLSFSVTLDEGQGCQWGTGNGLSSLFAQKKNVLNPYFWNMIREIIKFKDDASSYIEDLENNPDMDRSETLEHYVQSRGYSELFQKAFLIPTCASILSCSSEVMNFSAYPILSFLHNDPALQLVARPHTPRWCSQSYVDRVKKELESRGCHVRTNSEVYSVLTNDEGCAVISEDGSEEVYDGCIIAVHAPDALKMLGKQATHDESRILGAFQYAYSDLFLHHENNLMPKNPAKISETGLQFFLTLDPLKTPKNTLFKWSTSQPIPSVAASKALYQLNLIQGKRRLWFCGAYQGCGLPEDGVKVATKASLGFADAYIDGDFSFVDKNDGLLNFLLIFIANTEFNTYASKLGNKSRGWRTPLFYTSMVASAKYVLKYALRQNTINQARRNILQHYDLNNELFSLFMDETMTYSCAIFETPNEDLKDAQLRKIHTLVDKARISKEHHILEIGCGWGIFAIEVVKRTGCRYTGITLSETQLQYAELKVKEAGLQDQIQLLLCDYRQLPKSYNEMIEHVGHEFIEEFFKCCESALAENGILVLQFISVADEKYDEFRFSLSFIKEYIFPGGGLHSLSRITSAMAAASRLSVVHLQEIGCHYFRTLRRWRGKLFDNQSKIFALGFDSKFMRTWEFYFDYCAAGFKCGIIGNYQVVFVRPGDVAAFGNKPYNAAPGDY
ncbi:Tuberculostearic acid methyltransferase UfaA1 [Sesamum angolense]|uniref:Tuberculostearic acid methyltransferase UfaA1 n=1 Tax=Sesamum angolense TaxID=2727404 RepID=A0AAE2C1V0_9LAMI|nr:Tuberculostearic acid methyltransferase UfaA1 [Sesamum angolense]